MRTRGQAAKRADTYCPECLALQSVVPGGLACVNGHGVGDDEGLVVAEMLEVVRVREEERKAKAGEASRKLAEEVAKNDAPPPAARLFNHVRPGREDPLDPRVQRIVESVFIEKPDEVYDQVERSLRIGEKRTDHGTLMHALDDAEVVARNAHRLMITAKLEVERWELENRPTFAAMREEANGALQREKDSKARSKAITDADVEGMASIMFPDQFAAQRVRQRKNELMIKSLENLVDRTDSRCRSLQVMLGKNR